MVGLPRIAPLLAAVVIAAFVGVRADADEDEHDHDHERARAALAAGEVAPLREILARAERDFRGSLLEVELERERGRWVYELKLLTSGGAVVELVYDARTIELLGAKGRGLERALPGEDDD